MRPITKLLLTLAGLAALLAGLFAAEQYIEGLGYSRAVAEYTAKIETQKTEAATTLATEIDKTRRAEQALQTAKNNQEAHDAQAQKTVSDLSDRLRRAGGLSGRLRDPNGIAGCGGGGSGTAGATAAAASDRAADGAKTGGLLSAELSELLFTRLREADDINAAYASCRADSIGLRAKNAQP